MVVRVEARAVVAMVEVQRDRRAARQAGGTARCAWRLGSCTQVDEELAVAAAAAARRCMPCGT